MKKQLSILLISIGLGTSTAIAPQSVHALTLEEAAKLLGVWQRYAEDLQRTFVEPKQPDQSESLPPEPPNFNDPNSIESLPN